MRKLYRSNHIILKLVLVVFLPLSSHAEGFHLFAGVKPERVTTFANENGDRKFVEESERLLRAELFQPGINIPRELEKISREALEAAARKTYPHSVHIDFSTTRGRTLWNRSKTLALLLIANLTVLYSMPAESTNWTVFNAKIAQEGGFRFERVPNYWWANIEKGPHFDDDSAYVNFVGHPYAGANYFLIARELGFSFKESLIYSAAMSTLMWEFGLEAITERPSIQDMFATPLIGALVGELFYLIRLHIIRHDNRLFGSKAVGYSVRVLTNPFGEVVQLLLNLNGKLKEIANIDTVVYEKALPAYAQVGAQSFSLPQRQVFFSIRVRWPK